jgi:hypothetical protein
MKYGIEVEKNHGATFTPQIAALPSFQKVASGREISATMSDT